MPDPILENMNEKVLKRKQKRVPNSYIERYPALSASAEKRAYTAHPWFDKVMTGMDRGFDTIYGAAKTGVGAGLGVAGEAALFGADKLGLSANDHGAYRAGLDSIWGDVAASAKDVRTLGGAQANAARVAKHMADLKKGGGILGMSGETAANVAGYSDDTAKVLTSLILPGGVLGKIPGAGAQLAKIPFLGRPLTASGLLQGGAYFGAPTAAVGYDAITQPGRSAEYTESVHNALRKVNDALSKHDSLMSEEQRLALISQLQKGMVANQSIDPGELADAALQQAGYDGDPTFVNKAISTLKDVGGKGAGMLGAGDWYKKLSPTAQAAIPALLGAGGLGLGGYALYKMLSGGDDEEEAETPEEKRRQLMRRAKTASAYPALTKAAGLFDKGVDWAKRTVFETDPVGIAADRGASAGAGYGATAGSKLDQTGKDYLGTKTNLSDVLRQGGSYLGNLAGQGYGHVYQNAPKNMQNTMWDWSQNKTAAAGWAENIFPFMGQAYARGDDQPPATKAEINRLPSMRSAGAAPGVAAGIEAAKAQTAADWHKRNPAYTPTTTPQERARIQKLKDDKDMTAEYVRSKNAK